LPYNETLNDELKDISARNTGVLKRGYCYDRWHFLTLGELPAGCVTDSRYLVFTSPVTGFRTTICMQYCWP